MKKKFPYDKPWHPLDFNTGFGPMQFICQLTDDGNSYHNANLTRFSGKKIGEILNEVVRIGSLLDNAQLVGLKDTRSLAQRRKEHARLVEKLNKGPTSPAHVASDYSCSIEITLPIAMLAGYSARMAAAAKDAINKGMAEVAASCAFKAGFAYCIIANVEAENDARRARKSHAAALKKGRAMRTGSMRAFLEDEVKDWKIKPTNQLKELVKKTFPASDDDSILRQIRRLKRRTIGPNNHSKK